MAMRADYIWMNGKIIPWDQAQVHVFTHALHYGSSVFEGIRVYETAKGPALFRGREEGFEAVALEATDRRERAVWLEPGEFLPSVDRYPFRVAVAALAAMRGDEWIAV